MTLLAKRSALIPLFVALVASLALVLTGCSSSGEQTKSVYTQSQPGISITITLEAEGDRLVKQTLESVTEYESSGYADKETAKVGLDALMAEFPVIAGMDHTIEYGDTHATERLVFNFPEIDPAEFAKLNGVPASESSTDISLKEFSAQLEANGFEKGK